MASLSSTAHTIPPVLRFRATDSKSLSDSFWKSRVIACCLRSENLVKLGAGVNLSRGPVVKRLKAIEKAILSSDLGMTPNSDGDVIRLSLPPLTSERRKELTKFVAKQSEEGKVALRNLRRDALKSCDKLEKEKKLSEDNLKDMSSDLQKLVDTYMKKIEELCKQKEKVSPAT
ncbi:hypothetical protein F2Q70_00041286 [Brassica cretica]|uniref:Ribosome-recycling factor, chloroplastic n=1 Tax=Brassica cretica TaxID=69181 RepID=A0A8S9KAR2_BRACR|nr:hypothetical protein F2Q70_00041286 [Brassica cretica]